MRIASFVFWLAVLGAWSCLSPAQGLSISAPDRPIALPSAFPANTYTPHGYIDNPYHSMVFNRSGVVRSFPPLGFGWWRAEFRGNYGGGVRDHVNYLSLLQVSVTYGGKTFLHPEDFGKHQSELYSAYHTKHMMSYDWKCDSIVASLKYFLPRENTLACLVELRNVSTRTQEITLHTTNIYEIGDLRWWGSDGLTAKHSPELDAGITKVWAYGDVFVLGSSLKCVAYTATDSEKEWERWIQSGDHTTIPTAFTRGRGPLWMAQRYLVTIPAGSGRSVLVCLSRGKNEQWAADELKTGFKLALENLRKQLKEDQEFWSRCPILVGDWPETWKRGWVYDFETLRMNVRPPSGIFRHPWDAMQIHSPRVVLGETSLDMMTLSYANPGLAQEVIYGTFADALAPNVPCAREDGSVNMISSDGSECGTAPMWGYPFHVIQSIYLATLDSAWIRNLYPHLKAYIEWWLEHRTDEDGWLHCNNSWESGQDGSKRFLVAESNAGAVADFVRTVDVEASMAEAMQTMELFAAVAGKSMDLPWWRTLADRRIKNTRQMFFDGWFRDVHARTKQPIILQNYFDVMMLTPVTCGIATAEQIKAVKPMFQYFRANPGHWLEWPPHLITFTEAAWNASESLVASEIVAETADRVYARTDAREVRFKDEADRFSYRVAGVANEFWPVKDRPAGGENYGWGATLPMHIIRTIVGFREKENESATEFFLAPFLPKTFVEAGKRYVVRNLHYRGVAFEVTYEFEELERMKITFEYRSPRPTAVTVRSKSGNEVYKQKDKKKTNVLSFQGLNGNAYVLRLD
ncbi:MAG: hypothetical protein FJ217_04565 [Ignavibacteria bacterium]|nr:hypothetical protein [Ignavibacteria bacterium]